MEISKEDWKFFKEHIALWQERYMEKINNEYLKILNSDKIASEKFWTLEKRINQDKKHAGVIIINKRSYLVNNIQQLLSEEAVSIEELSELSDELKELIGIL